MEEDSRHWKGKHGTNKTVRQALPYRDQRQDSKEQKLYDAEKDVYKSYKKNQGWKLEVERHYVTTHDFGRHPWGEGPIRPLNWMEKKQQQIKKNNDDYDRGEYDESKRCRPCGKYYYGEGLKNHLASEKHKKQLEYLKSLEANQEEEDEWKVVMTRKGRKAKNEADRERAKQEKANAARAKSRGNAQAKPAKAKPNRRRSESESESEDSTSDDEKKEHLVVLSPSKMARATKQVDARSNHSYSWARSQAQGARRTKDRGIISKQIGGAEDLAPKEDVYRY